MEYRICINAIKLRNEERCRRDECMCTQNELNSILRELVKIYQAFERTVLDMAS